jgi:hypothetical protein
LRVDWYENQAPELSDPVPQIGGAVRVVLNFIVGPIPDVTADSLERRAVQMLTNGELSEQHVTEIEVTDLYEWDSDEDKLDEDKLERLISAVGELCPLGDNGFLDKVCNGVLRRSGQHRDAEELASLTNRVRAALAALKPETRPDPSECKGS